MWANKMKYLFLLLGLLLLLNCGHEKDDGKTNYKEMLTTFNKCESTNLDICLLYTKPGKEATVDSLRTVLEELVKDYNQLAAYRSKKKWAAVKLPKDLSPNDFNCYNATN